jgi:probable rRNA maturation factor
MAVPARAPARLHVSVLAPDGSRRPAAGLAPWLREVAPRTARGDVTVALVSDRRMRSLNRTFRGVDAVTDVLSFPVAAPPARAATATPVIAPRSRGEPVPLGDIVIATGVATRQAAAAGHALGTELRVLALHGLLHLLGFDHETDGGAMARTEQRLRRRGRLREGLIERGAPAPPTSPVPASRRPRRRA